MNYAIVFNKKNEAKDFSKRFKTSSPVEAKIVVHNVVFIFFKRWVFVLSLFI